MKISIVCPTYNSSKTLQAAFDCLLMQTTKPYQIVFSDDGSTDNTRELLHAIKPSFEQQDVHVTIIENLHQGPGATRNVGIKAAEGDWIAFLDSDDYWTEDKLQQIIQIAEKFPEANFLTHWEEYIRLDGRRILQKNAEGIETFKSIPKELYKNCFFSTSSVVCKTELLRKVGGFDPSFPSAQDYELWLKLSPYINVRVIHKVLGYYIEVATSITARPYYRRLLPQLRILWRHRAKGGWYLFFYRTTRVILSRQWYCWLRQCLLKQMGHAA